MLKSIATIGNSNNCKTKCAEIHYYTTNFTVVCLICKEIFTVYHEFMDHFHEKHLKEFLEKLQINELRPKNDPLLKEKPSDIRKTVPVKQEQLEWIGQQWLAQPLIDEELPEQLLCCKIEEEQETDNFESCLPSSIEPLEFEDAGNDPNEICNDVDWSHTYAPTLLKINQKRPYKPRNQPNSCSYCGKIFRRRYQLDTHLNIHTGLKPHQCDVCGRQFRAITTLQRHLTTHDKRKHFICKYCSKEFTHRAALVSHETRHTQERRVPCEDCGKLFYTQNQLDTHKRKLHKLDDNSLPFACDLCAKRYRSASMLSTHKFKKHYKTAKYACEHCGKKFVEELQLINHMSIHVKKK